MVLNYIWIAFFLIAFVVAACKLIFLGDTNVFTEIINASFASAKTGFEISLGLTGILSLWLGIMKIGEKGGVIQAFARMASPVFSKLFPDIPKDHPVTGSIFMNLSANLLGLDNAATPMGLKAMTQLQEFNREKDTASNPMIMFLCINASGLTLIPITIMMYRAQLGAANPSDVFLPIMLATFISTLVAILAVCFKQKINILQRNLLLFFGGMAALIGGLIWLFHSMTQEQVSLYSTLFANTLLREATKIRDSLRHERNYQIRQYKTRLPRWRRDRPCPARRVVHDSRGGVRYDHGNLRLRKEYVAEHAGLP